MSLAKKGYAAQQTGEPLADDRPDAQGDFDDKARSYSWQMQAVMNRRWIIVRSRE